MDFQLQNSVVLITGGTSGIGLASAGIFLGEGARVMISGRNAKRGQEAMRHLLRTQPDAEEHLHFVAGDVVVVRNCQRMVAATIERFDCLDIVVNSAGISFNHQIDDIEESDFDRMMNTILNFPADPGQFFFAKSDERLDQQGLSTVVLNACRGHRLFRPQTVQSQQFLTPFPSSC